MGIPAALAFARLLASGNSSAITWNGGRGVFAAYGTFGSGTLKLQSSFDDGTTWIDVDRSGDTYVTFTANGSGGFELPKCQLRVSLSGATNPSINSGVEYAFA